ncbi:MAG: hypothetical protein AAGI48_05915 [Verrucomicrobiota bacterium]
MTVTRSSFRKAVYSTLVFSIGGLALVCLPIIGPAYTAKFAGAYWMQIVAGYLAMILLIEVVGVPIRSAFQHYWAGMVFAFCLFIAGVLAGSATSMLLYGERDAHSYIVKPLFWMGIYGFIPAVMIGAIGSGLIRSGRKTGEQVGVRNL